jgi:hypothetical protein
MAKKARVRPSWKKRTSRKFNRRTHEISVFVQKGFTVFREGKEDVFDVCRKFRAFEKAQKKLRYYDYANQAMIEDIVECQGSEWCDELSKGKSEFGNVLPDGCLGADELHEGDETCN